MSERLPANPPTARDASESPRELLRAVKTQLVAWLGPGHDALARAVVVAIEQRRRLLRGSEEFSRDPRADTGHIDAKLAAQIETSRERLNRAVAVGLERRLGYRLNVADRHTLNELLRFGADAPRGVVACHDCMYVFEPSRKSSAQRCDGCHRHPMPDSMVDDDTITYPRMRWDRDPHRHDDANFVGWTTQRYVRCRECGQLFDTPRHDAITCSGGCRQARKRRRDAGDTNEYSEGARALRDASARNRELLARSR